MGGRQSVDDVHCNDIEQKLHQKLRSRETETFNE